MVIHTPVDDLYCRTQHEYFLQPLSSAASSRTDCCVNLTYEPVLPLSETAKTTLSNVVPEINESGISTLCSVVYDETSKKRLSKNYIVDPSFIDTIRLLHRIYGTRFMILIRTLLYLSGKVQRPTSRETSNTLGLRLTLTSERYAPTSVVSDDVNASATENDEHLNIIDTLRQKSRLSIYSEEFLMLFMIYKLQPNYIMFETASGGELGILKITTYTMFDVITYVLADKQYLPIRNTKKFHESRWIEEYVKMDNAIPQKSLYGIFGFRSIFSMPLEFSDKLVENYIEFLSIAYGISNTTFAKRFYVNMANPVIEEEAKIKELLTSSTYDRPLFLIIGNASGKSPMKGNSLLFKLMMASTAVMVLGSISEYQSMMESFDLINSTLDATNIVLSYMGSEATFYSNRVRIDSQMTCLNDDKEPKFGIEAFVYMYSKYKPNGSRATGANAERRPNIVVIDEIMLQYSAVTSFLEEVQPLCQISQDPEQGLVNLNGPGILYINRGHNSGTMNLINMYFEWRNANTGSKDKHPGQNSIITILFLGIRGYRAYANRMMHLISMYETPSTKLNLVRVNVF